MFGKMNSRSTRRKSCKAIVRTPAEICEARRLLTQIEFTSNVPGTDITIDGETHSTPFVVDADPGEVLSVETGMQTVGGQHYNFMGWSSGAAEDHLFEVGTDDASLHVMMHEHDGMGGGEMGGHHAGHHSFLHEMFAYGDVTHTAVQSGSWSDPATWLGGNVPDEGARVLITEDRIVEVNTVETAQLQWIRVDGTLQFATDADTRLVVDTLMTSENGVLEIGTEANPIQAGFTAEVIIAADAPIDLEWDPRQISRGIITNGPVSIHGAEKLDHVAIAGNALAGDTQLTLALPEGMVEPEGWQVGDTIVLHGTSHNENGVDDDNSRFEDEVLTITAINGNVIEFTNNDIHTADNNVLRFDHTTPEGFGEYDLQIRVANLTRNVRVASEGGIDTAIPLRGHVMMMREQGQSVQNAGFYGLGRSDKNEVLNDAHMMNGQMQPGTNQRGRYALHGHRLGVTADSDASVVRGNVVHGSPGWGIVHHQSHMILEDNVVFDVLGSGIAAEAGDEIGAWHNNIVIKTTGDDDPGHAIFPNGPRANAFDFGFNGEAYWIQGAAQVAMIDNFAASSQVGFSILAHVDGLERDADFVDVSVLPEHLQHIVTREDGIIDVTNVPMRQFQGVSVANSEQGIITWYQMRNDDGQLSFTAPTDHNGHSERSRIEDFQLWGIFGQGVHLQYTTQFDLVDGLILGDPENPVPALRDLNGDGRGHGISSNFPAQNHRYENIRIEGFARGIRLPHEGDFYSDPVPFLGTQLINVDLANNITHLTTKTGNFVDLIPYPDYVHIVDSTFESPAGNQLPTAAMTTQVVGGEGVVRFNGGESFDADPQAAIDALNVGWMPGETYHQTLEITGNNIAAYGWDFDGDGQIDQYGREVNHHFDSFGEHEVSLTVWDNQGQTSTTTQVIDVQPTSYENLLTDSGFEQPLGGAGYAVSSNRPDEWIGWGWAQNPATGVAEVSGERQQAGLMHVSADYHARRGLQTFSLEIANTEGDEFANSIAVRVWGIEGQFSVAAWDDYDFEYGAIPVHETLLMEQFVGGDTFDWTTFEWDVDFGDGYQFIVAQVETNYPNIPGGDYIAIDNAVIADATALPDLPTVSVIAVQDETSESAVAAPGVFEVSRTGSTAEDVSILYTVSGTADANVDYIGLSGTVVIPAGFDSATVNVQAIDDIVAEGLEDVEILLLNSPDYSIAANGTDTASLIILDNDLVQIADQQIHHSDGQLEIILPDGLVYEASIPANRAWELDSIYDFTATDGLISTNYGETWQNFGVRWVQGIENESGHHWYYLTPQGDLHSWNGNIETSPLLASFGHAFFADPALLHDASPVAASVSVSGNVLTIDPEASFIGTFDVDLTAVGNEDRTTFQVTVSNTAPTIADIQDQAISHAASALHIPLSIADVDGDPTSVEIRLSAEVNNELRTLYSLYAPQSLADNDFGLNYLGEGEKWIRGVDNGVNDGWYVITADNQLLSWGGSLEASDHLGTMSPAVHENPQLLLQHNEVVVSAELVGDELVITPFAGITGDADVEVVVSDGIAATSIRFGVAVTNETPVLNIDTLSAVGGDGTLSVPINATDADGDDITLSAYTLAGAAHDLLTQYQLSAPAWLVNSNYGEAHEGLGVRWLQGLDNGSNSGWYFLNSAGTLHAWNNSVESSVPLGALNSDYFDDPQLLLNASASPVAVSIVGNEVIVTAAEGFVGDVEVYIVADDGLAAVTHSFTLNAAAPAELDPAAPDFTPILTIVSQNAEDEDLLDALFEDFESIL